MDFKPDVYEKDLISVLMPAYNHENFVQDAIKSVISQNYKNVELLIIDDGSNDSTFEKIMELEEECKKRFKNFFAAKQSNQGVVITLNKLLELSKGEFIYFLASDDMVEDDNAFDIQTKFLKRHKDYSLVAGDNAIIDGNGRICYWDKERNYVYDENKATYKTFCDFLQKNTKLDFNSSIYGTYQTLIHGNYIQNGKLIRRSIFKKFGLFTQKAPLEDYWLMLQIAKYSKMKYINKILGKYRWHNSNTVKDISKMQNITNATLDYEYELINKCNLNELTPEAYNTITGIINNLGYMYYSFKIPYIFELLKYKSGNKKTRIIKIFKKIVLTNTKEKYNAI